MELSAFGSVSRFCVMVAVEVVVVDGDHAAGDLFDHFVSIQERVCKAVKCPGCKAVVYSSQLRVF